MANVGAVLSLLDGPHGCDAAYCVVWFRFRMMRRYLAYRPAEVGRGDRLLDMVREGCPGHGPVHLLFASATGIGFQCDRCTLGWVRPGLLVLSNLAGPIQHCKSAILDAWRDKVTAELCARKGFGVVRFWMLLVPCSSLTLLMSERERKGTAQRCLGGKGCVASMFRAGSVPVQMEMGTFFGNALSLLLLRSVQILNFMILKKMDKSH